MKKHHSPTEELFFKENDVSPTRFCTIGSSHYKSPVKREPNKPKRNRSLENDYSKYGNNVTAEPKKSYSIPEPRRGSLRIKDSIPEPSRCPTQLAENKDIGICTWTPISRSKRSRLSRNDTDKTDLGFCPKATKSPTGTKPRYSNKYEVKQLQSNNRHYSKQLK
ncbi:MAG: hypothetical protein JKX76_01050 [Colwellia sp.]|nr:hypothetical protein [Colwellia sp.]